LLTAEHLADLRRSGLSDETMAACGFYSAEEDEVEAILGFPASSALVIPYGLEQDAFKRVKPDRRNADSPKYLSPRGSTNRVYVPAILDRSVLADATVQLYVTEGEKKAAKAVQEGIPCIALAGVWSWRGKTADGEKAAISDLDAIAWRRRRVWIAF